MTGANSAGIGSTTRECEEGAGTGALGSGSTSAVSFPSTRRSGAGAGGAASGAGTTSGSAPTASAPSASTGPVSPKTRAWSDEERPPSSSGTSSGYTSVDPAVTAISAAGCGSAAPTGVTCTTPTAGPAPAVRGWKGGIDRSTPGGSSESGTVGPQV